MADQGDQGGTPMDIDEAEGSDGHMSVEEDDASDSEQMEIDPSETENVSTDPTLCKATLKVHVEMQRQGCDIRTHVLSQFEDYNIDVQVRKKVPTAEGESP
ncbi:hypothetical protein OS493_007533 [Desmophyllum pertusum]|uniref:Uncharacterized protein n=1 Tax=Desmophyllum pertusum TaxID=174260 RepID=A0A9X0CSI1_9CNID|nr:hypothetical protein OS493_007533 [Desmophyllum pertusum]